MRQMLCAREERAQRQRELLKQHQQPLICFTMNIPGPVKTSPLIRRAFLWGCQRLEQRLTGILHRELRLEITGCEGYYAVQGDALSIKAVCTALEEETPLGRLFDLDVLDANGSKLDRSLVGGGSRDCIVCGAPGRGCASRRVHPVKELQETANRILEEHFARLDRERIGALAVRSLLEEVRTTPKPGLVDRRNSGSHRDMDVSTFTASAEALGPYFRACVQLGQETAQEPAADTFSALRREGLRAEEAMYRATGGVNTHKGAIFTLGILCGSLGRLWKPEDPIPEIAALLAESSRVAAGAMADLSLEAVTAGQRLYRQLGLTGIRGEAAAGFPSVDKIALPVLRTCQQEGYDANDAAVLALLHLMAAVEDTNLYHRGGPSGAAWAKQQASSLLPRPSMGAVEALDGAFIARNLSPGGCADLLAAAIFLSALEEKTE